MKKQNVISVSQMMTKRTLIFLGLIITSSAFAQQKRIAQNKVPASIQQAFKIRHPNATVKSWEQQLETYTATYRWNKRKFNETFNKNGEWIKTVIALNWKKTPAMVREAFKNSVYKEWKIDNVQLINSSNEPTFYIVEMDSQFNFPVTEYSTIFYDTNEVYISERGEIIKVWKKS